MPTTTSENAMREAAAALSDLKADLPETLRADLVALITRLLVRTAERERGRGIELCRQRAELWRNTLAAKSGMAIAQEEARARANEAEYLADLLAEKQDREANGSS